MSVSATKPLSDVKAGDNIVGPYGRYEFRVTEITHMFVRGVYTKCPKHGYSVGSYCSYAVSDWSGRVVALA